MLHYRHSRMPVPGRASRLRRQLAVCKTLANADERVRVDAIDDERVSGLPPRTPSTRRVEEPPIPYEKSLAYRYFRTRPDDPPAALSSSRSSMSSSICAHTLNTSFFDDSQSSPPTKISSRM